MSSPAMEDSPATTSPEAMTSVTENPQGIGDAQSDGPATGGNEDEEDVPVPSEPVTSENDRIAALEKELANTKEQMYAVERSKEQARKDYEKNLANIRQEHTYEIQNAARFRESR